MKYRINPRNGDKISALGLGCMRFAGDGKILGRFDSQKAETLIKSAIDKGINYFDTAFVYGTEEILGKTSAKYGLRKKVFLATKIPLMMCRNLADLDKYFKRSLERLQTDYIDYYYFHMLSNIDTWDKFCGLGIKEWIKNKKDEGRIKQIGFSFHGSYNMFVSLLDAFDWDIVMLQYNYSDENYQAGVNGIRKAASKGLPVIVMEPLLGGRLINSLPNKAVECFKNVNPDTSLAAWGFNWLWNQPEITCVLSGMSEKYQIDDNTLIAENAEPGMLSQTELNAYNEVKKIFNDSFKIPCTGCHYCTPCPFGVDIPGCFNAYNTSYSINKTQGKIQYWIGTVLTGKPVYASECKKCGKCEPLCPQNIPIIKSLEEVKKNMEGFGFKLMSKWMKLTNRKKANTAEKKDPSDA